MCPKEYITKKKWHLDDTNTAEFHVPGDFKTNYNMQDFLSGLGANFVADRPGKTMGWYFGAGMAGGKEAFAQTPVGKAAATARKKRTRDEAEAAVPQTPPAKTAAASAPPAPRADAPPPSQRRRRSAQRRAATDSTTTF